MEVDTHSPSRSSRVRAHTHTLNPLLARALWRLTLSSCPSNCEAAGVATGVEASRGAQVGPFCPPRSGTMPLVDNDSAILELPRNAAR